MFERTVKASINEPVGTWRERWLREFPRAWRPALRAKMAEKDEREGNLLLLEAGTDLLVSTLHGDASDADLCETAERRAESCYRLTARMHDKAALLAMFEAEGRVYGDAVAAGETEAARIARYCDVRWWRRHIRTHHKRAVEGVGIRLGRVHKRRESYSTDVAVAMRSEQNKRNARAMEKTTLESEDGDRFTVAELAAKSNANKAIKRGELMLRMSGFETIATELSIPAEFITITCPSKMHRMTTVGGQLKENPKYDPTFTPREAQRYLCRVWARIRASFARDGIRVFGFRIAEPQHDGTPHHHFLLWYVDDSGRGDVRQRMLSHVRRHALAMDGGEQGAEKHRVDFEPIDPAKGTAVGYIAKYVAKNIDGYSLESDLFGNDAITASARVEAWASTWGVRQFQQIGGPPVGVWRELRRIKAEEIADAPPAVADAWFAAQKIVADDSPEQVLQAASYVEFVKACGGITVTRKTCRLAVLKVWHDELGRYGEPIGDRPRGIVARGRMWDYGGIVGRRFRPDIETRLPSNRKLWRVVSRAEVAAQRRTEAPWTRVNNCTDGPREAAGSESNFAHWERDNPGGSAAFS